MVAIPLSFERTNVMVEHCLQVYLSARHEEATKRRSQDELHITPRPTLELTSESKDHRINTRAEKRSSSDSKLSPKSLTPNDIGNLNPKTPASLESTTLSGAHLELPRRNNTNAGPSDHSDHDATSKPRFLRDSIFRPVENYIATCLAGCATMNTSFLTVKPQFHRALSEGQYTRTEPNKPHLSPTGNDNVLSEVEVDAKTLLLGDIAENGSWWTGERLSRGQTTHALARERSPDSWRGVVNLKSPRINWTEVTSWYHCVLNAGGSWRDKWTTLQARSTSDVLAGNVGANGPSDLLEEIENDLVESRNHLQRALLKATENLLKRPRRPLKHAEDCRFLFVILANPLLLSSAHSSAMRRSDMHLSARRSGPGQHSGIIKRVLGLIAHLPNEAHQFLVSWFSRLPESQFQGTVDLVGGFVTYRLSRPSQKRELVNPTDGLVPNFSDSRAQHPSQLHAALGGSRSTSSKPTNSSGKPELASYGDDWQVRAAARVMALLFAANGGHLSRRREAMPNESKSHSIGLTAKHSAYTHGQLIPISSFYNTMLDYADLVSDFDNWESSRGNFSFCQYPFFLSIYAKIHLMEMEARRQMEIKAREAFFDSILSNKAVSQFLVLKVRRDCLVEDS
jgi:E3 ubiquitin-protein ligase HECTD2